MQATPDIRTFLETPPGHTRVIGAPGSGKTTLLVERWRALEARGHRPGIIAFGREQQERLLELVLPPGGAHLGPNPVTTHALVASAVLDAARRGRPRTLRDVDELLVLGRLLRREPSLLASDLSAIAGSSAFLRDLLQALHALAQHGLSSGDAAVCTRAAGSPRVRDVFTVYRRYVETCAERGLVTFYDAAWRAAEYFESGGITSPLAGFDVVLIDDFQDLDPGQYHLLSRLVPPEGATALEVFGDPTGARFAFRGTTERFFQERFARDYVTTDIELRAPQSDLAALNEMVAGLIIETSSGVPPPPAADLPLFSNATSRDAVVARPRWTCNVSLVIADDEIAEAQTIASRTRTLLDAGVPPNDIVVIARDPARYRSALLLACHEWGVPLNPGGDGHGAAAGFVSSLLGALGSDTDGRLTEELASSPFFSTFCAEERDPSLLVKSLRRDYVTRADGFDLERLVSERVTPVLPRGDTASHAAMVAVIDEWRRYREVVASSGGGASLDEFRATCLVETMQRQAVPGRVTLQSPREVTGHSYACAFVCGCAEGYFPAAAGRDGYLSMAALARAVDAIDSDAAADLAARVDQAAMERAESALFLTAITRARDTLVILSPAKIGGEATLPARVLEVDSRPFNTEQAQRVVSPCARAGSAVAGTPAERHLAARLRPLDVLAGWWTSLPAPERLPRIASFTMSASKLNSFTRCERQFFYRNILRIEEPESIYLRVGSLVHEALKEIVPAGATGDAVRAALRNTGTREMAERLVSKELGDAGAWMRELSVRYLEDMLVSVARLEAQREGGYRVRVQEEKAETEIEGMPLRGRFDRIDDVEGVGPVIIDYKTSGNIAKTYPTLVNKIETEYWQIPVYAAMAAATGLPAAGFVYYVLPPGEESFAAGVQFVPGEQPAPIPLGKRRPHRYGPVDSEAVADAITRAVEIHRSIVTGECRYERAENRQICSNCHFARICQRSRASA